MDWSNKVVLITGASSGIGRGLSFELARRGASLGLLARGLEAGPPAAPANGEPAASNFAVEPSPRVRELADEIRRDTETAPRAGHQRILALGADVRDATGVRAAADRLRTECGRIDVLIANAGIGVAGDGAELDAREVANVIGVNTLGAVNSVAAVLPEMIREGSGHLVVISSLAAYRGLRKSAAYCASKASVSAFFESVRVDLLDRGIDVSIIHPGFIKTPLTARRKGKMPFLMELDDGVAKILWAIERRKISYAFPWQLAMLARLGMIMPNFMYDWISRRVSFRE